MKTDSGRTESGDSHRQCKMSGSTRRLQASAPQRMHCMRIWTVTEPPDLRCHISVCNLPPDHPLATCCMFQAISAT